MDVSTIQNVIRVYAQLLRLPGGEPPASGSPVEDRVTISAAAKTAGSATALGPGPGRAATP